MGIICFCLIVCCWCCLNLDFFGFVYSGVLFVVFFGSCFWVVLWLSLRLCLGLIWCFCLRKCLMWVGEIVFFWKFWCRFLGFWWWWMGLCFFLVGLCVCVVVGRRLFFNLCFGIWWFCCFCWLVGLLRVGLRWRRSFLFFWSGLCLIGFYSFRGWFLFIGSFRYILCWRWEF